MTVRKIKKITTGRATQDGAGVKLTRILDSDTVEEFDPFLMLDVFDSANFDDYIRGFPWHPHRGIETVTYILEGAVEHGDSLGHKGRIESGGCQWMTAGSGIIHQEMPKASRYMLGLQFWLSLPRADKMTPPKYHQAEGSWIPKVVEKGGLVRVIAGQYLGVSGALPTEHVQALFIDVELEPGVDWLMKTDPEATIYLYILKGEARFEDQPEPTPSKRAVLFEAGDEIRLQAGEEGLRFVLCSARPLREPVAWGGPIVMNTRAELNQAFDEIDAGTFVRDARQASGWH